MYNEFVNTMEQNAKIDILLPIYNDSNQLIINCFNLHKINSKRKTGMMLELQKCGNCCIIIFRSGGMKNPND